MLSYTGIWHIVNRWCIEMRVTRLRDLALLAQGIIYSRSGCPSAIVRCWTTGPTRHIHRQAAASLSQEPWRLPAACLPVLLPLSGLTALAATALIFSASP